MNRPFVVVLLAACIACGGSGQESPAPAAPTPAPQPEGGETPSSPVPLGIVRVPSAPTVEDATVDLGRELTQEFYDGKFDDLFARFSDELKQELPKPKLIFMHDGNMAKLGAETEVVSEHADRQGGYRRYLRRARYENYDGVVDVQWAFRDDDSVALFMMSPETDETAPAAPPAAP